MTRIFKFFFYLSLIVALGLSIWVAFAVWSGLYSVYSYPPSKENPKGATLLIERQDGEPMFNSPEYKAPPEKPQEKKGGVGFGKTRIRSSKAIELRTIATLPYVEWAYQQSLPEPPPGEKEK